jgi:hypothetical protein
MYEYNENQHRKSVLIGILLVEALVALMLLLLGRFVTGGKDDTKQREIIYLGLQDSTDVSSDGTIVVSEEEWRAMQNEVRQLRREVNALQGKPAPAEKDSH